MAKTNNRNSLKKPVTFSMGTVLVFVLAFGAIGAYALLKSFAAPAPPATLIANPNPAAVGSNEVFTGCGYQPNVGTTIVVNSPYATSFFGAKANASGCIDSSATETFTNQQAGSYSVNAWQTMANNPKKSKIYGSVTYTVQ